MKHFWVFTFVSIILTVFFGGFAFPKKGFAQSIDTQTTLNRVTNADGTVSTAHQITSAEYESLKNVAINFDIFSSLVPIGGFETPSTTTTDKALNLLERITTWMDSSSGLDKLKSRKEIPFVGVVGGEYLGTRYLNILDTNYNDKKNNINTTKNTLNVATLKDFITELNSIITNNQGGLRAVDQAKVVLHAATRYLETAQAEVKLENGQITLAEYNSAVTNATNKANTSIEGMAEYDNNNSCGRLSDSPLLSCINAGFTWFIKNILLEIVGFFMWMSAKLLNFSMYHGIFKFRDFAPDGIYAIWLVVRQIVSLFVFFTGLFVGFMAIIGKSEEFKKYIAFLVVFGLFVNFSYPIVRVFIDVSNVVSLQIYQTALGPGALLSDNPDGVNSAADRLVSSLGLQNLASNATAGSGSAGNQSNFGPKIKSTPGALAAVIFIGLAAYVFFMISFLIIVRTALLVCIIIASPILLVDTIVPALGEKAKWLRGMFVSQLFVAPVFTIMLILTLKFFEIFSISSPLKGSSTGTLAAAANSVDVVVFFNLIMMIVMLHIMLKVTKAVAGGVGETVTNWAGKGAGLGTGLTLGAGAATGGFAMRNTAGRFAKNLGEKDWGGGRLGNFAKDTFQNMGKRSYDLRNLGATSAIAGTLGITGMGQGSKKSYAGNREEYEKKALERAGEIQDDGERKEYLDRKFNQNGAGKFVDKYTGGTDANSKAYKNFVKGDEDIMKQYVNANEEGRKKMMEDEKNKKFVQRFDTVDNKDLTKMSAETRKNYEAKLAKDQAQKTRNEARIASYLTADQATRESIAANAKATDDKELQRQLDILDQLIGKGAGTLTPADVEALNSETLAQRVLANDKLREINKKAQETQQNSQATIEKARKDSLEEEKKTNELLLQLLNKISQPDSNFAKQVKGFKGQKVGRGSAFKQAVADTEKEEEEIPA